MAGPVRPSPLLLLVASLAASACPAIAHAQSATDEDADDAVQPRRAPLMPVAPPPPAPTTSPIPPIDPSKDQSNLAAQGGERPGHDGSVGATPNEVFSEDWWGRPRPVFEIHGYFRLRSELLHNFSLGRPDTPGAPAYANQNLWPQPADNPYIQRGGQALNVALCGANQTLCNDKTQAGANIRFRLVPEIHISDNLRILSQIDALDNLVLGSTPDSFAFPGNQLPTIPNGTGYPAAGTANPYAPISGLATTQAPPTAGINSFRNSIDVKRVWGEYATPIGQVRFGRMPFHWGLGMVYNAGDGLDSDWQTTYDRIQVVTGIRSLDLYFGGSWDFMATGLTNSTPYDASGGIQYNVANLTNVNQWSLFAARRKNPELQRLSLARGDVVVNGGLLAVYRTQFLDNAPYVDAETAAASPNQGLIYRGLYQLTSDAWLQVLWRKFRLEAEFASVWGKVGQTPDTPSNQYGNNGIKIRQWAVTTQTEFRAIEDKLHMNFGFGWASGDPWERALNPGYNGWQPQLNQGRGPLSTFRYHPDYRVDLIFFRRMLTRVEGAYYFRPSVDYDFIRNQNGQKLGGGAALIWSRASEFVQTPGHKRDLGVELDVQVYYQAKDGALNDDPSKVGGFFAMLQYGVFFPLGGLSYLSGEKNVATAANQPNFDTSAAQTVRLFLGIVY